MRTGTTDCGVAVAAGDSEGCPACSTLGVRGKGFRVDYFLNFALLKPIGDNNMGKIREHKMERGI